MAAPALMTRRFSMPATTNSRPHSCATCMPEKRNAKAGARRLARYVRHAEKRLAGTQCRRDRERRVSFFPIPARCAMKQMR